MTPTLDIPRRKRLRDGINHVAYSPDGRSFAYSDVHMTLTLPGGMHRSLKSSNEKVRPTDRIRDLAFTPDGRSLLAAAGDHIWQIDAETGEEQWSYRLPRVLAFLIVSPLTLAVSESDVLAAATDNGQILVWDRWRNRVGKYDVNEPQRAIAFAGKSDELVSAGGFTLRRLDVWTGKTTADLVLPDKAYGMAVSTDGDLAAVRTLSKVLVLDAFTGRVQSQGNVEPGLPLLRFHPTRPLLAVGENYFISLIDFEGRRLDEIPLQEGEVVSFAFAPDGSELAVGCSNGRILGHKI